MLYMTNELDLIDSLISLIEDGGSKNNRNKWNGDEQLLLDLLARKTEIGELRLKKKFCGGSSEGR